MLRSKTGVLTRAVRANVMLGTLSVVDLRLFEAGLRDQSISQIASDPYPLTMIDLLAD
jgi:hypothetical protein